MAEEQFVTSINEDLETTCWGCGLRLLLPSSAPIFKCGWCGAITKKSPVKSETKYFRWRRWRDRFFLAVLAMFMTLVICGGLWAIYPVVFSISLFCGVFHCVIAVILAVSTILTFSLAAFTCAGTPPNIPWGSYPAIGKGDLENYTFCRYCSKPKSPRTHHCRTCRMCIVDMDHHCPFIGNCVGAGNHRYFVAFLTSAVISTIYVAIMSIYTVLQIWPPLKHQSLGRLNGFSILLAFVAVKEIMLSLLSSAVFLPARGLLLVYLFFASASVNIGLSVLLWQQLCFIYAGKTYLSHISSEGADGDGGRDCQNLYQFFGCPYFTLRCFQSFRTAKKKHNK